MREIIPVIEGALGHDRLTRLKRNPDAYQQFWLGVLEAMERVDWSRESVAFLISNGYGAVRNMRRAEDTLQKMKVCPECGRVYGYRVMECRECRCQLESDNRVSEYQDYHESRPFASLDEGMDVISFVATLSGTDAYVARRWLIERADLTCQNHLKQIAFELGVSVPRVAQLKKRVKESFRSWYFGS